MYLVVRVYLAVGTVSCFGCYVSGFVVVFYYVRCLGFVYVNSLFCLRLLCCNVVGDLDVVDFGFDLLFW